MSDRLNPGDSLAIGGSIISPDRRFTLTLQADGNLVLYQTGGAPRWASGTVGRTVSQAVMQADGNFVLYGPAEPIWATATEGHPGSYLAVQNDGNVVIYGPSGPLWSAIDVKYLRLHIIPLTNTERDANGNPIKPFAITPEQFASLVLRVNWSFDGTGIQIVFDPATDWQPMADTQLNTDAAGMREHGNQIAASILGKIVCFLRWGPDPVPTGNGNAYPPPGAGPKPPSVNDDIVQNYIALPNRIADNFGLLNQGNGSFVAHEVGHYLGLYHTFPGWDGHDPVFQRYKNPDGTNALPPSLTAADQAVVDYIAANGGTINALDGDLLSDTPPDPTTLLYQVHNQAICAQRQILVSGTMNGQAISFTFAPDPNNVMSYYQACGPATSPPPPASFSPQQVQRMLQTLRHPSRRHLLTPDWSGLNDNWRPLGGVFPVGAPVSAVARMPNHLDLFVVGNNGRVYTSWWHEGSDWSGLNDNWRPLGGVFPVGAPVSAVARMPNHLDLFVVGNNGRVYTSWWHEGSDWSGLNDNWRPLGGVFPVGAPVSAVARMPNHLDLFVVGNDGRVYTSWWHEGSDWSGLNDNWRPLGGVFPVGAPVSAVARMPNHLDLFVVGNDGRVYTSWWHEGSDWSGLNDNWRPLGGVFPVGAPVSAVARMPNHLDLFVVGNDGRVYTSWWHEGSDWSGLNDNWRPLGGFFPVGAPVSAVARMPNHLDLFVVGNDGRVYTSWWHEGSDWSGLNDNWRPLGGFFPVGAPVSAVARMPNHLDLFVVGNNGRVYTSWWHEP